MASLDELNKGEGGSLNEQLLKVWRAGSYEGEAAENMYFIKQGILQVIKDGRVVYTFEEGGYFGEIALLCDQPRSADVRALTDCMLLSLSCDSLWEVWFCSFELNFGHMAKVGLRHLGRD